MKQKITQLLIITIGTLALFTGCQEELKIGQERVIESSKRSQPNWVKRPPKANRKHIFFVGQDTSFENDNRYAYQMALSDVSSYISTKTNTLFKIPGRAFERHGPTLLQTDGAWTNYFFLNSKQSEV